MAQRIVTTCDVHANRGEDVPGLTWSVAIGPPGGKVSTYEVDMCPDDGKGLQDLLDMLADMGRKVDGPGRPRKAPATVAGVVGTVCPECGREDFASANGLAVHRRRAHGVVGPKSRAATGSDG